MRLYFTEHKYLIVILVASIAFLYIQIRTSSNSPISGMPQDNLVLRIATTTSLYDTDLWNLLGQSFEDDYGAVLHVISGGTGKAIQHGQMGDVDLITVHDPIQEDLFLSNGYGTQRYPFAYNYFSIVGPDNDPADIRGHNPQEAMIRIMEKGKANPSEIKFISRGDKSGTHAKEISLWELSGKDYQSVRNSGEWYQESAAGMGAVLNMSDQKKAYTLTDMSTYTFFNQDMDIVSLVTEDNNLLNIYSAIPINPLANEKINSALAADFIEFLYSKKTQDLIGSHGIEEHGEPFFNPISSDNPKFN